MLKEKNWQRLHEFRVIAIDDFDMMLGINFYVKA